MFFSRTSQIYSQQNVEKQVCWLRTENEIAISLQVITVPFIVSTLTVFQLSKDYQALHIPMTNYSTNVPEYGGMIQQQPLH